MKPLSFDLVFLCRQCFIRSIDKGKKQDDGSEARRVQQTELSTHTKKPMKEVEVQTEESDQQ